MKKYLFLLTAIVFCLASCGEKELTIAPQEPKYDLSDSDTDPVQHLRYQFYQDYNVILIDDVDTTDYMFTISNSKLDYAMVTSTLSPEKKIEIFKAFETTFLKKYAPYFVRNYTPLKIIIADEIAQYKENKWTEQIEKTNFPFYLSKTILAISTRPEDMKIENGILSSVNSYGELVTYDNTLIKQIVIEDILVARYGEKWDQLFLNITGPYRPYLNSKGNGEYDGLVRIDFGSSYVDPSNPDHLLKRPFEEFPAPNEETQVADVEAYLNMRGVPSTVFSPSNIKYYPNDAKPSGRLRFFVTDLVPIWIEWSSKHDDVQKQAKFEKYPELKKTYVVAQELLKKYTDIDI